MITLLGLIAMIAFNWYMFAHMRAVVPSAHLQLTPEKIEYARQNVPIFLLGNILCAMIIAPGLVAMATKEQGE